MQIPHHYTPRPYQARFLSEMRDKRIGVLKWARRAGKGLTTFAYAISRMVEEPMGVVIVYPSKQQGYDSFWNSVENDGFRTIEHVPQELIVSQTNTSDNMSMVLMNGSTLTVVGSNANPEAIRGQNTKLYILSEFVDITPGVLGIIRPVTAVNKGQIIIESTVKQDGISGGTFLRLYKAAENDPTQLAMRILATEYMTDDELEQVRQDYIAENGDDFLFRQEFLLDEGAALNSSYYGNAITQAKQQKRVGLYPYDPDHPVYTSWDLGAGKGTTAIVFWQYHGKKLTFIDSHETHDIGDSGIVEYLRTKPYVYGWHFLPHDGSRADSDSIARIQKLRELGLANASLLQRKSKEDGIKRLLELIRDKETRFHEPMTSRMLTQWAIYKRKYNEVTGDYEGPEHKSESHIADAGRYCAEAIDQFFHPESGKLLMENDIDAKVESEQLITSLGGFSDYDMYGSYDF